MTQYVFDKLDQTFLKQPSIAPLSYALQRQIDLFLSPSYDQGNQLTGINIALIAPNSVSNQPSVQWRQIKRFDPAIDLKQYQHPDQILQTLLLEQLPRKKYFKHCHSCGQLTCISELSKGIHQSRVCTRCHANPIDINETQREKFIKQFFNFVVNSDELLTDIEVAQEQWQVNTLAPTHAKSFHQPFDMDQQRDKLEVEIDRLLDNRHYFSTCFTCGKWLHIANLKGEQCEHCLHSDR